MNPKNTRDLVIDDEIDLLVDGELDEERREALLERLEADPDGWKRCAGAFLEAQIWREAIGGPTAAARLPHRRWRSPLANLAAAVLGFLAAVAVLRPEEAGTAGAEPLTAPDPEVRVVTYPVVEHTGFVPASDERGNLFYQTRGDVPDFFLQALREAGHDVEHVRRVIDLPVEDGAPLQLPITETRVFVKHEL